jgi:hypothetical protein
MKKNSDQPGAARRSRLWSIGIYAGDSPLRLSPHPAIDNPVVTCEDVTDIPAILVADPFMTRERGTWFMFFEAMNRNNRRGEIGLATSGDGLRWTYENIVLAETFHLSYPYIFKWDDDYFMVPETRQAGSVRLYQASAFPGEWRYHSTLLDLEGTDPSIFRYGDKWWMFLCTPPADHASLNLYMAEEPTGPWREHPKNPIVRSDPGIARPAGRPIVVDGNVIRFAQDCCPEYGTRVRAFEVFDLTPDAYQERESPFSPVFGPADSTWNRDGMHHVDPHPVGDSWLACVDGWSHHLALSGN